MSPNRPSTLSGPSSACVHVDDLEFLFALGGAALVPGESCLIDWRNWKNPGTDGRRDSGEIKKKVASSAIRRAFFGHITSIRT